MDQLDKTYNPKVVENKIYKFWEEKGLFNADKDPNKRSYCIVIPPPNITGILHMGHALNNTIQDILIRYKRMQGYQALWLPGTDHAGIATQNVVEKNLSKQGKKRHDLGREKFVKEVWQWQKEYGGTIIKQLRRLGCSCDWRRERFTMDEGLSNAVVEVFIRLYEKGLIYRGNYIINWCPRCQTALSDEEAQHREIDGNLYYIRYPFKDADLSLPARRETDTQKNYIVVATTRPETMLGDTAVAVNPEDKRYSEIIGKSVVLPIMNRELKIISDDFVDPGFATGVVKVTPAHDPNDFLIGQRHKLEFINIMGPDGVLNDNAGKYKGKDRFKARQELVNELNEQGLLEKIDPHRYSAGHCYRCHTIIEPCFSKQWFVKMKPLAEPAIKAVEQDRIRFYPARWTKVYLEWMNNIRDWCISRQIWWGHRIPVYYCKSCEAKSTEKKESMDSGQWTADSKGVIVSKTKPSKCPDCGSKDIIQDEDVLDTWFSSWLWPFSTFGWPFNEQAADLTQHKAKEEFEYFYPTSCLVTAQEIIFFWVARMVMAGLEFCRNVPFKDVYIHGTVRDATGTKMSKSLGNIIDPIDVIDEYGADALRFSIISITAAGQDVFLSKEKFEMGRNFTNKIWNVSRFLLMNLKYHVNIDLRGFFRKAELTLPERWILSSLYRTMQSVNKALDSYKFNEAANLLYDFVWHKYCDWFVEIAKLTINEYRTQVILFKVLEKSLRMLHPFMPFATEEIWQKLDMEKPIMIFPWPHVQEHMIDAHAEESMNRIIDIVVAIRNIRSDMNIEQKAVIGVVIKSDDEGILNSEDDLRRYTEKLAGVNALMVASNIGKPRHSASAILDYCEIFVPLEGLIDIEKERERLNKKLGELQFNLAVLNNKLKNKDFIQKAPPKIVENEKEKQQLLEENLKKIINNLSSLSR